MANVSLQIAGMSCNHCVMAVNKALKNLSGIEDAQVQIGSAQVTYAPEQVNVEQIKAAVSDSGYQVVSASA